MKFQRTQVVLAKAAILAILVGVSSAAIAEKGKIRRHDGREFERRAVDRDIRRHERDRRAFVAGAAAQRRNDYYRDGYRDRYRDRYRDDDDDNLGDVLIGAAVGAMITGAVMNNSNANNAPASTTQP